MKFLFNGLVVFFFIWFFFKAWGWYDDSMLGDLAAFLFALLSTVLLGLILFGIGNLF